MAAATAFPIVARCDMFWPEHASDGASSNHQYIHLNDTLIAPIWESAQNITSVPVWVPPGEWEDGWSGATVTGPQNVTASQPYERIPMWHRRGGFTVITSTPGLRVDEQDWGELTIEAYPSDSMMETQRFVYSQGSGSARTSLRMKSTGHGSVQFDISASEDGAARAWVLRLHLKHGQAHDATVTVDGAPQTALALQPMDEAESAAFFPFGGVGAKPAPAAGSIVEIRVVRGAGARTVTMKLRDGN